LQDHIIPFLGTTIPTGAKHMTVTQMAAKFGIMVEKVPTINSLDFLQKLKDTYIDIGFSLRCYQKFGPRIIKHFNSGNKALLNLHPGKLPQYRGVITAVRAMMNRDPDFGYSLHHMNEQFDAGAVIDIRCSPLDYHKTMLGNFESAYEIGVSMVEDAVEKFARGGDLMEGKIEQDEAVAGYYTFLTREEDSEREEGGIRLCDGEEVARFLVDAFGGKDKGERERERLRGVVEVAAKEWQSTNNLRS